MLRIAKIKYLLYGKRPQTVALRTEAECATGGATLGKSYRRLAKKIASPGVSQARRQLSWLRGVFIPLGCAAVSFE